LLAIPYHEFITLLSRSESDRSPGTTDLVGGRDASAEIGAEGGDIRRGVVRREVYYLNV
jgi:hypothetical protein